MPAEFALQQREEYPRQTRPHVLETRRVDLLKSTVNYAGIFYGSQREIAIDKFVWLEI